MKYYYALEQTHGNVSPFSSYGRPTLHIFYTKNERDEFVQNFEGTDINNFAVVTDSKTAYDAYSSLVDGIREFDDSVVKHD